MEHFKLYQRGTKEATVSYRQESHDTPYMVRLYDGETLIGKLRSKTKSFAAEVAMRWINSN